MNKLLHCLFFGCLTGAEAQIHVAYPSPNHRVAHDHVLIEGHVPAGAGLSIDGRRVEVAPDGLFVLWHPLRPGLNNLSLHSDNGDKISSLRLPVRRAPAPTAPQPPFVRSVLPQVVTVNAQTGVGVNSLQDAWRPLGGGAPLFAKTGMSAQLLGTQGNLSLLALPSGERFWANTARLDRGASIVLPTPTLRRLCLRQENGNNEATFGFSSPPVFDVSAQGDALNVQFLHANLPDLEGEGGALQKKNAFLLDTGGTLRGFSSEIKQNDVVVKWRTATGAGLAGKTIVIDAGHGGSERGGAGPFGTPEKDLVLPIATLAAQYLREMGANVIMTRQSDVTVPLYNRPLLAERSGADALVSLHANAIPDGKSPVGVRGIATFYSHDHAEFLATALHRALLAAAPSVGDDGLRPAANLALTRPTSQPSVLLELGYLTHPQNLRVLHSPQGQDNYARAIAAGLAAAFAVETTPPTAKERCFSPQK